VQYQLDFSGPIIIIHAIMETNIWQRLMIQPCMHVYTDNLISLAINEEILRDASSIYISINRRSF